MSRPGGRQALHAAVSAAYDRAATRDRLQALTEAQWQATVIDAAKALGWLCMHPYDSRRSEPGYPDLTLVRDRVVFVELKSETGRLTPQQHAWIGALNVAGAEVYVWRPADFDAAIETLKRRAA